MALEFPTFNDLNSEAQAELARQLPSVDPSINGSWARGFTTAGSALAYTVTLTVRDVLKQAFPQTSEGEFLELWGGYENLPRNQATGAFGDIILPGALSTIIPAGTSFTASNGFIYSSNAVISIISNSITVATLARVGSTVTATTPADHGFASNIDVTIAGSTPTDYNGIFQITVTGGNTFTYQIETTPGPAVGTLTAVSDFATVPVASVTTGLISNLSSGAAFTLETTIPGVIEPGYATFYGLVGGADVETDADYLARILLSRSIIQGVFTPDQIRLAGLSISGNTRVFVVTPSFGVAETPAPGFVPIPGQVAAYVLRDNDDNIIPTQTILDLTKQAIIAGGALPGNTYEGDVYVLAPNTVSQDFNFSELVPNTVTMQNAVTATLEAFFEDSVQFQTSVTIELVQGAIANTVDIQTGERIRNFTLSNPTTDIVVAAGEIALLGDVGFS